ncbi:hypothetical protein SAMN04488118_1054 [Epibacterium ulvae]|uniref:Uncharacterized protein n=1 Tax=Epibacterium ulvae TaxID=1156985 RepID=A0A1G5QMZ0_9RHOB|nr:hypothetical protein SAMN04488118_1054 [Epibacterium ulvae]
MLVLVCLPARETAAKYHQRSNDCPHLILHDNEKLRSFSIHYIEIHTPSGGFHTGSDEQILESFAADKVLSALEERFEVLRVQAQAELDKRDLCYDRTCSPCVAPDFHWFGQRPACHFRSDQSSNMAHFVAQSIRD